MSIEEALIIARFAHYAALLVLFGASLFPLYAGLDHGRLGWLRPTSVGLAAAALVSGLAWYGVAAASMAGTFAAAIDPGVLAAVLQTMAFGQVWLARMALILIALFVAPTLAGRALVPWLAGLSLAGIAATGHGPSPAGPAGIAHALADVLHLLSAGWWLGGLWALGVTLRQAPGPALGSVIARFSGVGYIAAATLVMTGVVNAWLLVGSPDGLVGTPYGRLLVIKIALFLGMAALAAANRFWITPRLAIPSADPRWLSRLRRHVWLEQALGVGVIAVVSVLGTLQPAVEI
ncbi:MAG: copper homeostasis membrane protein CopD [Caulobacteraceae bacterium]|nr:copper homeostasis membrane protein CopD [Caulobacteraceae bacterium]